jgi:hypothetical protein
MWVLIGDSDASLAREVPWSLHRHEPLEIVEPVLAERVQALLQSEDVESWSGGVISATPTKVRIQRPR